MTTQEKQIKVAEIMGWTQSTLTGRWFPPPKEGLPPNPNFEGLKSYQLPDWLNSIDAIRAAVLAQSEAFQKEFDLHLFIKSREHKGTGKGSYDFTGCFHKLDAYDWCDAFLAAHDASKG